MLEQKNRKRVAYHTLGCKVNQYDTEAMRERFEQAGYQSVNFDQNADIYVINTCTVTGTGDKKSLQLIRRCHRLNPNAQIIVTGCLAQRATDELRLPGVRLILGTQRRGEIVSLFEKAMTEGTQLVAVQPFSKVPFERLFVSSNADHTRAYMKIQEGCNRFCTYCIIPYVRGPIRSRSLDDITDEAKELANRGYREIVLTGIHLTSYGLDLDKKISLTDAIARVHAVEGIERIRLGSLEPVVVNSSFIDCIRQMPKVCHQFHLALQSGSDTVLKRMHRRYTASEFLECCRMLRDAFTDCALTTDVMTGFPGETEAEFEETKQLCREAAFARMHVFPYSERKGTPAADMPDTIPVFIREKRARELIELGKRMEEDSLRKMIGQKTSVLIEEKNDKGFLEGYTDGYMRAVIKETARMHTTGELLKVIVQEERNGILTCEIFEQ